MALDEFLFGKAVKYFREKKRREVEKQSRTVRLSDLQNKLTLMACAVTGQPIEIFQAEREGGFKNNSFFLPATCALFPSMEQNQNFYLFRVMYLATQKKLNLNWNSTATLAPETAWQKSIETSSLVLSALFEEFPAMHPIYEQLSENLPSDHNRQKTDHTWLFGKWMRNEPESTGKLDGLDQDHLHTLSTPKDPKTTIKAKAVEEIIRLEVDKKAQEDYVLTHNFEKVETADEFSGVWRDFDGDDELENHQDALDELNMKYVVRVDDPVHSVYQSDFLENATVSESKDTPEAIQTITYNEWDFSKRAYKIDYCKLFLQSVRQKDESYYERTITENASILVALRKMLTNVNNKMSLQRRQPQGEMFDIDAVTDMFADLHSGRTPSEKIYLSNRKKDKDISILLLLDVSMSSDSYAAGNRILDVEKQAAILFGEILDEFGIDFSINCFYSKTRNQCVYVNVKEFDESWQLGKTKVGAVEPGGYTRIGTALRHSGALLDRRDAQNRWLILLSDGKPNDYDRYEGKYGIQDVKQALRELNERGINTYALAIEATAKHYLPQMFGVSNWQILSSPVELITALVQLYERIRYAFNAR
ncbi:MAG: VWA domain-containing protein [Saprospiraceae bacterium]|nr:VWA domain-containing protein [Saprospiraceae bacterium]